MEVVEEFETRVAEWLVREFELQSSDDWSKGPWEELHIEREKLEEEASFLMGKCAEWTEKASTPQDCLEAKQAKQRLELILKIVRRVAAHKSTAEWILPAEGRFVPLLADKLGTATPEVIENKVKAMKDEHGWTDKQARNVEMYLLKSRLKLKPSKIGEMMQLRGEGYSGSQKNSLRANANRDIKKGAKLWAEVKKGSDEI